MRSEQRVHAREREARRDRGPKSWGASWAEASHGHGEGRWAGFGQHAEREAAARYVNKKHFPISFSNNFQIPVFKSHFEQENDLF
jgi:hypothetical protein